MILTEKQLDKFNLNNAQGVPVQVTTKFKELNKFYIFKDKEIHGLNVFFTDLVNVEEIFGWGAKTTTVEEWVRLVNSLLKVTKVI